MQLELLPTMVLIKNLIEKKSELAPNPKNRPAILERGTASDYLYSGERSNQQNQNMGV